MLYAFLKAFILKIIGIAQLRQMSETHELSRTK